MISIKKHRPRFPKGGTLLSQPSQSGVIAVATIAPEARNT